MNNKHQTFLLTMLILEVKMDKATGMIGLILKH